MKPARLTTTESLMLDVIRVVAACVVAFGHLTQRFFSTSWTDLTIAAQCAVAVFFLLSGFVIRYVTTRRPATFRHYLGDRASRIWSIAIPALLFTLLADTLSLHINPGYYQTWRAFYTHPLFNITANLLFCGQLWTHAITPLSNSPYWSVNYEVAYYLLYGCWFYLTGIKRWFSIAAIGTFFGPRVLYLAPLWVLGCGLHDLYQHWTNPKVKAATTTWLTLAALAALLLFFAIVVHRSSLGEITGPAPFTRISNSSGIRQKEYFFGLLWPIAFIALLYAARQLTLTPDSIFVRATHFIAEGTFPIYLLHFPLYVLIAACIPYNHAAAAPKLLIFAGIITIGILAGHPGNILKLKIRNLIFQS